MPLLPLDLPLGMYKNGTPYTRLGRWSDGNLVRWHDGAIRPIGGWQRRTDNTATNISALVSDPADEVIRDIYAWSDLSLDQQVVLSSNRGIYHLSQTGTVTDITPGGYTGSDKDASVQAGYGQNPYGVGVYGAGNNLVATKPIPPDRWYYGTFGEVLLTGVRGDGTMYELDLGTLTLSGVTNAPSDVQDLCVTQERQVFAIGGGGQPRRVQASEVEDRTQWTAATDNQVIDRTLTGTGRTDRFAVWWGERNFWVFDGAVQVLNCDVIDYLYADLEPNQVSKITAFTNTDFSEIWWLYQSLGSTTDEVDSYVVWNYKENHWNTGKLDRTTGYDKGVLLTPIMVDSDGQIWNHELDAVLPDGTVFVETGAIELGSGDKNMAVRYIYPDNENQSDVTFELIGRQFPNDTEYTYGPYPYNNPVPTRALGRTVKVKVNFETAASELGKLRLDIAPIGTGKR